MRRLNAGAGVEYFDPAWCESTENALSGLIHKTAISTVEGFKMPEEQDHFLQMQIRELSIHAVEGMGDRMGNVFREEIFLQVVNTLPCLLDFPVLKLGDSPDQYVHAALILRENGGHFLADDHVWKMRDF